VLPVARMNELPVRFAKTLRAVAVYEALKGTLVLLAGFGLLATVHRDVQLMAERLVAQLHLDPASHFPRIFLDAATNVTDHRLRLLAFLAAAYALIRFLMAFGLWFGKRWAEWLVALSAAVYLPLEVHELSNGPNWFVVGALVVNLLVVGLMIAALRSPRSGKAPDT
jgi:uncharacterized membrane protein (DUF2068 family)